MCSQRSNAGVSIFLVHSTLILVQILFGIGQVVGKLGLPKTNPLMFALVRECIAGPLLLLMSFLFERGEIVSFRSSASHSDVYLLLGAGFSLFVNQFCNITGVKLANAVISSAWQPAQPIFTLAIAICLGMERPTGFKVAGILLAFGGAVFLACFGQDLSATSSLFLGNMMFLMNDLGTACYVLCARPLLKRFRPMTITGLSYLVASLAVVITALIVKLSPAVVLEFFCDDCAGQEWGIPGRAIYALTYWIVINSITCYAMMTWANQYVEPSKVLAYTALQPTTAAILSIILVYTGAYTDLALPSWNLLGLIGIISGVVLVAYDDFRHGGSLSNKETEPLLIVDVVEVNQ